MKRLVLMFMLLSMLAAIPMFAAQKRELPQETLLGREGVKDMAVDEVASLANVVTRDARFQALLRLVEDRRLFLQTSQVKGLTYPEGHRAVFIPILNEGRSESGFIASNGEVWTLSLDLRKGNKRIIETFSAKLDQGGQPVVEAGPVVKYKDNGEPGLSGASELAEHDGTVSISASTTSCQYVSRLGVNWGCWSPSSNPFAYYYVWTFRYGSTPDPRSPNWWGCYRGGIHVCPRFESSGSPITFPVCGFPPNHPQG